MIFNPEIKQNSNEAVAPNGTVDIFYIRHGAPEGKYAHNDMPYDEFYKALNYSDSLNIKLDSKNKNTIIESLNKSNIQNENIKLILTSPYLRSKETANIAHDFLKEKNNIDIKIHETELLREIDFDPDIISEDEYNELMPKIGFWGIMKKVEEKWLNNEKGKHENAEESYKRAKKLLIYLQRIRKFTRNDKILMVSHGWFGRVVQHVVQNGKPEDFFKDTDFIKEAEMYGIKHDINQDNFLLLNLNQNE